MYLFAAIVPPRHVVDEVREVVAAVRPPGAQEEAPKRGLLSRRRDTQTDPSFTTDELSFVTAEQMYLPVTGFGNVTLGDSVQLAKSLRAEAAGWPRPTVHVQGATALEFKGDESVWAKLAGDVDELMTIGRGVPQVVQRLGFFVDRRAFRPWLSVATITDTTTAPYLEAVVGALDGYSSAPWTVEHLSLMRRLPDVGPDAFEETEQMPFGA